MTDQPTFGFTDGDEFSFPKSNTIKISPFPEITVGAATPGFNSLIPAPSVPSLVSTELVELLCRASNVSTTDPYCFVKQKQDTVEVF